MRLQPPVARNFPPVATVSSMDWSDWHKRLMQAKKRLDPPKSDADLTEQFNELVVRKVKRAQFNHFLRGKREPYLSQLFALCEVLDVEPASVLGLNEAETHQGTSYTGVKKKVTQQHRQAVHRKAGGHVDKGSKRQTR